MSVECRRSVLLLCGSQIPVLRLRRLCVLPPRCCQSANRIPPGVIGESVASLGGGGGLVPIELGGEIQIRSLPVSPSVAELLVPVTQIFRGGDGRLETVDISAIRFLGQFGGDAVDEIFCRV